MASLGQTEYQTNYQKENLRQIRLKLNRKTEPELLAWIEKQENIQGYIKRLIKRDMEENGMKYHIKPEYLDLWEGGDTPSDPDRTITEEDVYRLASEWEKPVEELLEQLIPIEMEKDR